MIKNISIIIPTFNRNDKLLILLKSIFNSKGIDNFKKEIVIVNDNYHKLKLNLTIPKDWILKIIDTEWWKNVSYARNLGFQHSFWEVLYFIDDDNEISENLISETMYRFNHWYFWLLWVIMLTPSWNIWSIGWKVNYIFFTLLVRNIIKNNYINEYIYVDYIPNLYITTRFILDSVWWFDYVSYPIAMEEVDLANKIKKIGWKIWILNKNSIFTVHHFDDRQWKPSRPERYYFRWRSRIVFYYNYYKYTLYPFKCFFEKCLIKYKVSKYNIDKKLKKDLVQSYKKWVEDWLYFLKNSIWK